jgi:CubicO group peptidase (beta-lactamase class C family)
MRLRIARFIVAVGLMTATCSPADDGVSIGAIDEIVAAGIAGGQMPGAVVLIQHAGRDIHRRAYGDAQIEPERREMLMDALFDLASLTKPVATATSVMILVDEGQLDLDAPASLYLPEFTGDGKEDITVRQLLTHQGGLIADNHLRDYADGPDIAWERICGLELEARPGEKFIYSDVSFMVLGQLVERVSGQTLDEFANERIFEPLGMHDTGFRIADQLTEEQRLARCVPTELRDGEWMLGEVHDPRAFALGGVAGHAGLFSTADDLSRYARMILSGGELDGVRILSNEAIATMASPQIVPGGHIRGLGWDKQSSYSSNRGEGMSEAAIGHGGFTGTAIWIDPDLDLVVIFLSSRLHPDGEGTVNPLIGRIGRAAVDAATGE